MSAGGPQLVTAAGDPAAEPTPAEGGGDEFIREVTLTIKFNLETKDISLNVNPPEIATHRDILYAALELVRERVNLMAVRDMLVSTQKKVITPDDFFRNSRPRR